MDPIEVAPSCPGEPIRGPEQYANEPANRLLSNFETGTTALAQVAGRNGSWIRGSDGSSGVLIAQASSTCAARGKWAGHFAASGFTSWGNNWTAVFRAQPNSVPMPYDGSGYSAISFWAAFGADNGTSFAVPVGITTMDTAWNSSLCSPCNDYYATTVPLTHDWQHFVLPFSDMAQAGFGNPQLPMRRDQLVGFIIYPKQQFDIWIDDVRLEP